MYRIQLILIFLFHLVIISGAQDVVITLIAKNFGTPVKLDSIFLENLDAPGSLMLNVVPYDITSYDINLSKGKIINGIGDLFQNEYGFHLYSNEPGLLRFYSTFQKNELVSLTLYDLTGRCKAHHEIISPAGVMIISYSHGGNPAGIVVIKGGDHLQTFKVLGGTIDCNPMLLFQETGPVSKTLIQNNHTVLYSAENFIFTPGDKIRFTVYHHSIYPGSISSYPTDGDSLIVKVSWPCPGIPFVSDFDGNIYKTVQIGSQCWMRENMKAKHYSNGDTLVDGTGVGAYDPLDTTKYWFDYDDNPDISAEYGRLYTWSAAMNGIHGPNFSMIQGICPTGWHVPTDGEWQTLEIFLGMSPYAAEQINWRGTNEGGKLKESGISHWLYPNVAATNESGFTALPGGADGDVGFSYYLQFDGYWWTATPYSDYPPFYVILDRLLDFDASSIYKGTINRGIAHSVRCLKN